MSKATVVFANGSKQIAHNLDDTMFRWHLRKLEQTNEVLEYYQQQPIAIRDCSSPSSPEQALTWRTEVQNQLTAIQQHIHIVKTDNRLGGRVQFEKAVRHLKIALFEIQAQLRNLKQYIVQQTGQQDDEKRIRRISVENNLIIAQAEIIRLQRLLIEHHGLDTDVVMGDGRNGGES